MLDEVRAKMLTLSIVIIIATVKLFAQDEEKAKVAVRGEVRLGSTFDFENQILSPWIYDGDHGSRVRVALTYNKGDFYAEIDSAAKTGRYFNAAKGDDDKADPHQGGDWGFLGGGININYWNQNDNDFGGKIGIALAHTDGTRPDVVGHTMLFQQFLGGKILAEIGFGDGNTGSQWWIPVPIDKNYDEDPLFRLQFRLIENLNFGIAYYNEVRMPFWHSDVTEKDTVTGDDIVIVKDADNIPKLNEKFFDPLVAGFRYNGNPLSFAGALKAGDPHRLDPRKNLGTQAMLGAEYRLFPELVFRLNCEGRNIGEFVRKGAFDIGENVEFFYNRLLCGLTVKESSLYRGNNAPLNTLNMELLVKPYIRYRIFDKSYIRLIMHFTRGLERANEELAMYEFIPAFFHTIKGDISEDIDGMNTGFLAAYTFRFGKDSSGNSAAKNEFCFGFKVVY
jgi:hypothetical protein